MKLQIMAKLFDRMAHVVKASVDTGQDGVKFAAYRVRLFGVRRIDKSGHVHLHKRAIIISFRYQLRHYLHISHSRVDQSCEPLLLSL